MKHNHNHDNAVSPCLQLVPVHFEFTQATRAGRRDRTLLLVAAQTGLHAAELIGLRCQDVVLGCGAHVRCLGKGRRERCTPLRKDAVAALRAWIRELEARPSDPLFPDAQGQPLSHDGLAYIVLLR
jgi:integrase/recombinase XerD